MVRAPKKRELVVITHGKAAQHGRVGVIASGVMKSYGNAVLVQFGPDGPFKRYKLTSMRRATPEEERVWRREY